VHLNGDNLGENIQITLERNLTPQPSSQIETIENAVAWAQKLKRFLKMMIYEI
jgi:hypothetical protein